MKYSTLVIFLICSIAIQAQTYEGSIGEYPICLELDMDYDDNRATAFYFYKSHLQNIILEGNCDSSELMLFEKFSSQQEQKELFLLSINKGKLSGTWTNNGITLPVDLAKTTKEFDEYKLEHLTFVRDSISTYTEKELVWFTEKYSQMSLFRLGNGFTKSEREFLNPKLDSMHNGYAKIGLECDWAEQSIELEIVSNQYLSYTEYSSIYCGGAHPSYNTIGYNFDLKNKIQLFQLTDIYPNVDHYQLLKKKYGNDADLEDECEYFTGDDSVWNYYSWVITKNGITITPLYPHAMTPCEMGFSLTNEELETGN